MCIRDSLYTVCAELFCDGKVTDCVEQKIGFRSYRFDPKQGFFLNGRSYPLHGVSRHQDWKELGNAITKEHHDKDMELIREVGANSIRPVSYTHLFFFVFPESSIFCARSICLSRMDF